MGEGLQGLVGFAIFFLFVLLLVKLPMNVKNNPSYCLGIKYLFARLS